jgi:hypothetical protein
MKFVASLMEVGQFVEVVLERRRKKKKKKDKET